MQRGTIGAGELRSAEITDLPDGRIRLTRRRAISAGRKPATDMFQDWGTLDDAAATGVAGGTEAPVRLINQMIGDLEGEPALIQIYEEIPESAEIQVGNNTQIQLEDGRTAIEAEFLQFSTGTYAPGTVGTTTAPGDDAAFMQRAEQSNDGTLRRIKRTYVYAGILSTDDESLNNGKLLKKTIVSAKTVPTTQAGFTLVGTPVQNPNGFPTYSYTYAKGEGEISRRTSSDQGGALQRVVISHLTAPEVDAQPTADPLSGGIAIVTGKNDQDGYRVWEVTWVKGLGEAHRGTAYGQSDDAGITGATVVTITHLTDLATGSQPTASPGSGFVLINFDREEQAGFRLWSVVWAKGTGLVSQSIEARQDGLRGVTNISLGTRVAPDGIIILDNYRIGDGYKIFTVATMQSANGGAVTSAAQSFERWVPFTYPGRAKAYTEDFDGKTFLSCFESPPVATEVLATVAVSYSTTHTLGTITNYWNPADWAVVKKQWVGAYGRSATETRALPGFRSVSESSVEVTGSGFDSAIDGGIIYAGTTARIVVTGGPTDPGGTMLTLFAENVPAFISTAGVTYYRKTLITAAIPTQADLPV